MQTKQVEQVWRSTQAAQQGPVARPSRAGWGKGTQNADRKGSLFRQNSRHHSCAYTCLTSSSGGIWASGRGKDVGEYPPRERQVILREVPTERRRQRIAWSLLTDRVGVSYRLKQRSSCLLGRSRCKDGAPQVRLPRGSMTGDNQGPERFREIRRTVNLFKEKLL